MATTSVAGAGESPAAANSDYYDRAKELKEFEDSKAGVKGLVDSGVVKIPRIFIHAAEILPKPSDSDHTGLEVPIVDLHGIDGPRRRDIVEKVREASMSWGFFQLVNHGVPIGVMEEMIEGVKRFHEQDKEEKAKFYSRDPKRNVMYYSSNFDIFGSPAANWRDAVVCLSDDSLDPQQLPPICREVMIDYRKNMLGIVDIVCEMLSEALGVGQDYLKSINCAKTHNFVGHYYPPCPEPNLTLGITKHSDPSFFTTLLQDDRGGLQVLHQHHWVNVTPIRGAIIVNIGDLLQLISNDMFKSVEHRVLASHDGPRMSVAMFLKPSNDEENSYGPIKEVLSDDNPPIYKEILVRDYMLYYSINRNDGNSALPHFKI